MFYDHYQDLYFLRCNLVCSDPIARLLAERRIRNGDGELEPVGDLGENGEMVRGEELHVFCRISDPTYGSIEWFKKQAEEDEDYGGEVEIGRNEKLESQFDNLGRFSLSVTPEDDVLTGKLVIRGIY